MLRVQEGDREAFRKLFEKLENSSGFPLVLSKSFIVHEQIHQISLACQPMAEGGKLLRSKRILYPCLIGKTKGDII